MSDFRNTLRPKARNLSVAAAVASALAGVAQAQQPVNDSVLEEVTVSAEFVGDAKNYLVENATVTMTFVEEKAVQIELPPSVVLTVSDAPEGLKGDSANNVQKTVTLETGITINAPLFIKTGEKIKVDTRTGKYMERA